MAEKLVILVTRGPEDPEMATIPFVMATAAQASNVEVLMGFQNNGAWLMLKGIAERVHAAEFPPLKELMDAFVEEGGTMFVCGPCVKSRAIRAEDFIEGASVVNAATFVAEITAATSTLVY